MIRFFQSIWYTISEVIYLNDCAKAFYEAIRNQSSPFDSTSYQSTLDLLWYLYTQHHPVSDDSIQVQFDELSEVLQPLSQKRKRRVLFRVHQLCYTHERISFTYGLQAGAQLMVELLDK